MIRMFLGHSDPLARGTGPALDLSMKYEQATIVRNLGSYCLVTFTFSLNVISEKIILLPSWRSLTEIAGSGSTTMVIIEKCENLFFRICKYFLRILVHGSVYRIYGSGRPIKCGSGRIRFLPGEFISSAMLIRYVTLVQGDLIKNVTSYRKWKRSEKIWK